VEPAGCLCLFFLPDFWKLKYAQAALPKKDAATFGTTTTEMARVLEFGLLLQIGLQFCKIAYLLVLLNN
jgi:hypothetical protein